MEGGLIVRQATANDIQSSIQNLIDKEDWNIGKYEKDFFYDVDNTGFYIGELNGVPVSCISVVKYGHKFAFIGYYITAKEYRGQGIGLKTFQAAMASLNDSYTCGLYCKHNMIPIYERCGFVMNKALILNCETTPSLAMHGLFRYNKCLPGVVIKPIDKVSLTDVFKYDNFVFGAPHHKYLKGLLSTPEYHGFVATVVKKEERDSNEIVGLIMAQRASLTGGWLISPLFANSLNIAGSLLYTMFELLISKTPNEKVELCAEVGINKQCKELIDCLNVTLISSMVGMYQYAANGSKIDTKSEFVYAVSSPDLG